MEAKEAELQNKIWAALLVTNVEVFLFLWIIPFSSPSKYYLITIFATVLIIAIAIISRKPEICRTLEPPPPV